MRAPQVRLVGLRKCFGGSVAVRSLDLCVPAGAFFSIVGPSGCGKTTTLRMIAGLEAPDGGRIEIAGEDVTRLPAYRRPVNTVFQSYALFPHLDVFENIAFGLREERRPRKETTRRVQEATELVQLSGRERSRPRQLSGGEQQRVALARALVKQPRVLLLDEPLGSLDLALRKQMQVLLKDVQRRVGITFLYVTHDQEEAFAMSDEVAVMNQGLLDQVGTPEVVYRRPANAFVAEFIGTTNRLPGSIVNALADGTYSVDIGLDAPVNARGPSHMTPGGRVMVIVRPEELRLLPFKEELADSVAQVPATVETTSYFGSYRQVRLSSARLGTVIATLDGRTDRITVGRELAVTWSSNAAWLVPVESSP